MEDRHSIIILVLILAFAFLTVRAIVRLESHHPVHAGEYPGANF